MSHEPRVLAVGNINIDLTFYMEKSPELDSEAFARDFISSNGGSASNFAVGVARLGLRSGIVGCVGGDSRGREAIKAFRREGVSVDLVKSLEGERTGVVCVLVDPRGTRTMVAFRGANRRLGEAVTSLGSEPADVLQISNVGRGVLSDVLGGVEGNSRRTLVSLDPGGSSRELSPEDLVGADILLLNEEECGLITGRGNDPEILAGKVGIVVVKRGARGCVVFAKGERVELPAFTVKVEDPTGAGDAFDAGFIAGIVSSKDPYEGAKWGSAAAAMKIRRRGAWNGLPTKEGLMEFLEGGGQ